MKKLLLSASLLFLGLTSYAQHTQTATGFTNGCDEVNGTGYEFTQYFPDFAGGGGPSNVKLDTISYGWGINPNFSFYLMLVLTNPVDLSANSRITFHASATGANLADTSIVANIGLENAANEHLSEDQAITLTKTYQGYDYTFTPVAGKDFTAVKKVVFTFTYNGTGSRSGGFFITDIEAGSLTTSTSSASSLVSSSKLFPNPTNDNANVELNLKSASDVKITLSDVMGKEVMTIAEGTFASMNQSFSVANLNKGIYTVNYTVNGAPAKSELLMVK